MQITIENPDYTGNIDQDALASVVSQLATMAQRDSGDDVPWEEVTLYLMDDESIAPVHMALQGIEGATDVITQRYEPVPGEPAGLASEIFVNLQCACREGSRRQAARLRSASGTTPWQAGDRDQDSEEVPAWSVDRELALYIAHGCDHLTDAEDESEEGFQAMRARELRWLDELRLTPIVIKPIIDRN